MRRRGPVIGVLVIGIGLALAPVAFQMFERAPRGGDMIDGFAPYMTTGRIEAFRADLATIGAAHTEARDRLDADRERFAAVAAFDERWPAIDDDMGSMLTTMERNIDNYDGVAALPPFPLFPWFFVIPGVLLAGSAGWSLLADRGAAPARTRRVALIALGAGLVAAPAVFQMFDRAPGGADMIDDFRPFMTTAKVTEIQGYFLTIGTAEGELRRQVVPDLIAAGGSEGDLPAVQTLVQEWPRISNEMAPMIGAMADNVDNFAAVKALPPFWLFPWFFVVPGLAVIVLAGRRQQATAAVAAPAAQPTLERV